MSEEKSKMVERVNKPKNQFNFIYTQRPDPLCTKRMAAPVLAVEHRLPTNTGSGIPFTLSKKKNSNIHVHTFASVYVAMKTIINTHTQNNNKITNVLGPIRFCLSPSLQSLTQDK